MVDVRAPKYVWSIEARGLPERQVLRFANSIEPHPAAPAGTITARYLPSGFKLLADGILDRDELPDLCDRGLSWNIRVTRRGSGSTSHRWSTPDIEISGVVAAADSLWASADAWESDRGDWSTVRGLRAFIEGPRGSSDDNGRREF